MHKEESPFLGKKFRVFAIHAKEVVLWKKSYFKGPNVPTHKANAFLLRSTRNATFSSCHFQNVAFSEKSKGCVIYFPKVIRPVRVPTAASSALILEISFSCPLTNDTLECSTSSHGDGPPKVKVINCCYLFKLVKIDDFIKEVFVGVFQVHGRAHV